MVAMFKQRYTHIWVLSTVVFLFHIPTCFSQNIQTADSLLQVLEIGDLSKEERAKNLRSVAFFHPDLNIALTAAKESLEIAKEIEELELEAEALEEISHLERRLGNNSKSLAASLNALQIYEKLNLTERVAASYTQLASNYISDENYVLAIDYLKKARDIYSASDKKANEASTILNLGEAYRLNGNLEAAVRCFEQTLTLNSDINNIYIESYSLGNLGMVQSTQGEFGLAEENLKKAIKILEGQGDLYSSSVYIAALGEVYKERKQWSTAEDRLLEALALAQQAGLKEQIRDVSDLLSNFYESRENFSKALEYRKLFQQYQDSLVNKENIQKIEQLNFGYQIDKKESEIGLLNKINTNQKYLVWVLAIGIFLLLFFGYLLYRINSRIKKANTVLSEQKLLISKREKEKALLLRELNHRVKNNLQMISSLLNLQSRELTGHPAKEAIEAGKFRVEALSLVHRKLYQEGVDTRIWVKEYIEELVLGLFHGYNAPFEPEFEIDNISIHIDLAVPLALIVNELIINSLKYAYTDIDKPSLKVHMKQENKVRMDIQIIDNGVGFAPIENENENSFGLKLINSLVEQLEGSIDMLTTAGTHWKMNIKIE